jgi:hypothetical protein
MLVDGPMLMLVDGLTPMLVGVLMLMLVDVLMLMLLDVLMLINYYILFPIPNLDILVFPEERRPPPNLEDFICVQTTSSGDKKGCDGVGTWGRSQP